MESTGIENQEFNFIYGDLEGEKLSDFALEDDNLLMNSPPFRPLEDQELRLSGLDNPNEHEGVKLLEFQSYEGTEDSLEKLLQEGEKVSCHDFVPGRPSYLRQSLAWDNAFFTSAGILDGDELKFMNEGLKAAGKQLESPALRNIKIGFQNKTKTSALERRNTTTQRSMQNKSEHMSKRKEPHSLPLKAPKVFSRMKNVLLGQNKSASVDCHARVKNLTAKTVSAGSRKCTLPDSTSISNAGMRNLSKNKGLSYCRLATQSVSLSNSFSCTSPVSSSFSMSSYGPRSRTKQKSNDAEVCHHTPAPQDEVNRSPPHRKSRVLLDEHTTPVLQSKQGSTETYNVPSESRKRLKPSYLRVPSPKIGFFDEKKSSTPTIERSLQFCLETQSTPPTKSGMTSRITPDKHLKARTSSETKRSAVPAKHVKPRSTLSGAKLKNCSRQVWSPMDSGSEASLRSQSSTGGGTEVKFGSRSRKASSGICERKRVVDTDEKRKVEGRMYNTLSGYAKGQKTDPIIQPKNTQVKKAKIVEDKANTLANLGDQINDLSKYFEAIDLTRETLTKKDDEKDCCTLQHFSNSLSKLNGNNIAVAYSQKQDMLPNLFPGSRTPLANKTSISNTTGSFFQSATIEKLPEKPTRFCTTANRPCKENTLPLL